MLNGLALFFDKKRKGKIMEKYTIMHKVWNPPSQNYYYYSALLESDSKSSIMDLARPYLKDAVTHQPDTNQRPHTVICLLELQDDGTDVMLEEWFIHEFELHEGEVITKHIF